MGAADGVHRTGALVEQIGRQRRHAGPPLRIVDRPGRKRRTERDHRQGVVFAMPDRDAGQRSDRHNPGRLSRNQRQKRKQQGGKASAHGRGNR